MHSTHNRYQRKRLSLAGLNLKSRRYWNYGSPRGDLWEVTMRPLYNKGYRFAASWGESISEEKQA